MVLLASSLRLYGQAGVAPRVLFDPSSDGAQRQVELHDTKSRQVTTAIDKNGLAVRIAGGTADYPGIVINPADGKPWNLALYGHVEAKITNTGTRRVNVNLRVDNEGDYRLSPWNAEGKNIDPGQTKTLIVYFGYSYGFQPSFKLKPEAVARLLLFTGKTGEEVSFRVEQVQGAGWVGERVGVDPDRVTIKPAGGVLLDASTAIQAEGQIGAVNGAKGSLGPGGRLVRADFSGGPGQSVTFRPAEGLWNLNGHLQVTVRVKNVGENSVTPSIQLESEGGPSDAVAAAPLAPGDEAEIVVPFAAKVPWKGESVPAQLDPAAAGGTWKAQPGTGTEYRSNQTSGIVIRPDKTPGPKSVLVSSIVAGKPPLSLPDWLGTRPPVEGDWVQTLNEEFDGNTIDLHRWNVYSSNWWDKRMHFSKDQVIVADGMLHLRLEKKPGHHNDDPAGALTDYAAGQPDTYGKWTQRYGYFEIRQKQPTAPCLWPGFWMMPDRGRSFDPSKGGRNETGNGGMEFDITESQSSWGIHRFNVACHWDNYGKEHKSIGSSSNYVQADADGYIVVGLLWLPGRFVVYGNGQEIFRWESPRVSAHPAHLILQNEIGGWDAEPVDDTQLPADYVVDYIRVWQRKDLASPADGPKPNQGRPDASGE
jgi:beta-glucanase (GH16 family)